MSRSCLFGPSVALRARLRLRDPCPAVGARGSSGARQPIAGLSRVVGPTAAPAVRRLPALTEVRTSALRPAQGIIRSGCSLGPHRPSGGAEMSRRGPGAPVRGENPAPSRAQEGSEPRAGIEGHAPAEPGWGPLIVPALPGPRCGPSPRAVAPSDRGAAAWQGRGRRSRRHALKRPVAFLPAGDGGGRPASGGAPRVLRRIRPNPAGPDPRQLRTSPQPQKWP